MAALALGVTLAAGCGMAPAASSPTASGGTPGATPSDVAPPAPGVGWSVCWSAPPGTGSPGWRDRTEELGLTEPLTGMMAHATAAGDVNDDGWVDLFVGTFADRPSSEYAVRGADGPAPDRLLLGSPDGYVVDPSFPQTRGRTSGAAFADLDDDGDLDLVVARNPRRGERQSAPSVVLRNDDGRFSEAAVLDRARGFRSVGVLHADGDRLLDLFVVEDRWTGGSSVLYRNDGEFRFTDATAALGLPTDLHGLGVSTADLDDDTRADLFVAGSNRLFLRDGDGFREDRSSDFTWTTYGDEDDPAGVVAADLDADGRPELVVGQHYNSTLDGGRGVPVRVYANRGARDGEGVRFDDVTQAAGMVTLPTKSPHVDIADVDADGRPDIVTTAAATDGGPVVLRNVTAAGGALRFEPRATPAGPGYWVTGAVLDADHDGALDVVLAEWDPRLPTLLLSATGGRGHWLAVDVGAAGSAGVGAVVSIHGAAGTREEGRLLGRVEISAQAGYGAGAEPVARFGLGDVERVDVEVRPAGGGQGQRLTGVTADAWVRVGAPCGG